MFKRVLDKVDKNASWKRVLMLFIGTMLFASFIISQFFGLIKLDPNATMDSETYYTSSTFYTNLEVQGETGRQSYLILHLFDYIFMVLLALLLIFTLYLLLKKMTESGALKYLALIPLISGTGDFLENLCIDISILIYPRRIPIFGSISGYFSALKLNTLYVSFTLILILTIVVIIQAIRNRQIR